MTAANDCHTLIKDAFGNYRCSECVPGYFLLGNVCQSRLGACNISHCAQLKDQFNLGSNFTCKECEEGYNLALNGIDCVERNNNTNLVITANYASGSPRLSVASFWSLGVLAGLCLLLWMAI